MCLSSSGPGRCILNAETHRSNRARLASIAKLPTQILLTKPLWGKKINFFRHTRNKFFIVRNDDLAKVKPF